MQVCPRKITAAVTVAGCVDREEVPTVTAIGEADFAAAGKECRAARVAGWYDAIKHIHAAFNAFENIFGQTDTHQVTRFLLRQERFGIVDDLFQKLKAFTDTDASNCVAGEIHGCQCFGTFAAQIIIGAALYNTEQRLVVAAVCFQALLCPAQSFAYRFFGIVMCRRVRDALIEGHDDIGTQSVLNAGCFTWPKKNAITIDFVFEKDACVGNLLFRQGEDLEATAVCQDRFLPVHELVQATGFFNQSFTGFKVQVICVGEDDLGASVINLGRGHRLESAVSSDRHENGRFYRAVWCRDTSTSCPGLFVFVNKFKLQHAISFLSGALVAKQLV